jgi:protein-S-isoprenylcysteine O-methyltransferase Ste14
MPGTVGVLFPYILYNFYPDDISFDIIKYIGILIVFLGFIFYFMSVLSFMKLGGTPQIYFMKKIEKIFGLEPNQLANDGIYNFSRNPMYSGVTLTILGQALFFESILTLLWSILFFMVVNIVVVFIEEPHLKKKYGEKYIEYFNRTPRWLGLTKRKNRYKQN